MEEIAKVVNGELVLDAEWVKQYAYVVKQAAIFNDAKASMGKVLCNAMEENKILKYEDENIVVTYIPQTKRETFDTKRFEEEHQEMYDEYIKLTDVKSSIRITQKQ